MKSNLGEKTIIKRVTIAPHGDGVSTEVDQSIIEDLENDIEFYTEVGIDSNASVARREKEALIFASELGVWYQEFAYTPVYVDLNGSKTAGKEEYAKCVDPRLTTEEEDKLAGHIQYAKIILKGLGNSVAAEVNRQILLSLQCGKSDQGSSWLPHAGMSQPQVVSRHSPPNNRN